MRTMCSREIFTKKCRKQQIFDSDLKGAWHYNHVTFTPMAKNFMLYCRLIYRVFSHDVTAAILVSQNNETAAMLVSQTSPVGVELFSYVNAFFCSNKFAYMLAT